MRKQNRLWFVGCLLLLAVLSMPATSRADCNGRCFIAYWPEIYPYCGLSLYGTRLCIEGGDYCAEFACPYLKVDDSETASLSNAFPPAQAGLCQAADLSMIPEGSIKVTVLRNRI